MKKIFVIAGTWAQFDSYMSAMDGLEISDNGKMIQTRSRYQRIANIREIRGRDKSTTEKLIILNHFYTSWERSNNSEIIDYCKLKQIPIEEIDTDSLSASRK